MITILNRVLCFLIVITILACPCLALAAAGFLCSLASAVTTVLVGVVSLPLVLCCAHPQALACAAVLSLLLISERRVWA